MTVDEALTTTRSVRKRLDLSRPVPRELVEECLEIAVQAPTASNRQPWTFIVLTEPEPRQAVAQAYRKGFQYYATEVIPRLKPFPENDPRALQAHRITESAVYLAERMHQVPVLVLFCIEGELDRAPLAEAAADWGTIAPAAWSFMVALHARGLGSTWTTVHLVYADEVARALAIPDHISQAALIPVAYAKGGDFRRAGRIPARQLTFWNRWGGS
ncbi:MAG: oxidoreductase [Candidatus Xenobia bacterium]|jgi:nitroreductase